MEAELFDNPNPQSGFAEGELRKDISRRTELWKQNSVKMFPKNGTTEADLRKGIPSEWNCRRGTL